LFLKIGILSHSQKLPVIVGTTPTYNNETKIFSNDAITTKGNNNNDELFLILR
jgi:hypothetical protein